MERFRQKINCYYYLIQGIKNIFKSHSFNQSDGRQFAPLHWLYAVKQDGRNKVRLVIEGHETDAEDYNTFASNVRMEYVGLKLFLTIFWR